jgi:hypothetical protein
MTPLISCYLLKYMQDLTVMYNKSHILDWPV